jgi:signal peptidase I
MAPTIKPGEMIQIDYTAYMLATPKRWDVVAFEPLASTNALYCMRVVGLPSESVGFASGGISVNGQPLALPLYLSNVHYVSLDHPALHYAGAGVANPYIVPSDCYFVLGDNPTNANDSRFWGAIPKTNIVGKVRGK